MKNIFIACCILAFFSCKQSEKSTEETTTPAEVNSQETTPEKAATVLDSIAMAHGLKQWRSINKITYTFNVDRGASHFERTWSWQPKTSEVMASTADTTLTYQHNKFGDELKPTDQAFINDKYWLLFPFNLVWDSGLSHKDLGQTEAPISKQQMRTIEVNYNSEDGYTPGDTYTIYVDSDYVLREWSYTPSGKDKPALSTTWENYVDMNGIKIAKMHQNADKSFKLYFTDLSLN